MASSTRCPRCGRENEATFAFCLDCGQSLRPASPPTEALCTKCGQPLQPGFKFCGHCGSPVQSAPAPAASPAPPAPPPRQATGTGVHGAPAPEAPAPAPAAAAAPNASAGGTQVRLSAVRHDGLPGAVYLLDRAETVCGRIDGDIRIAEDATISPRHARFSLRGGALSVEDLGSVNGTFIRIRSARRLSVGDEFRIGRQLLRVEPLVRPPPPVDGAARPWGTPDSGFRYRLSQLLEGGGLGEVFPLKEGENAIGREAGDVTFPNDRYVSARHARLDVKPDGITLTDVGSSNGTFVKVAGSIELGNGDQLLVGGQLLRVDA
ncbi:MAG: FHA domain-containing protein [Anaeromyxobacteraceae bacterium]